MVKRRCPSCGETLTITLDDGESIPADGFDCPLCQARIPGPSEKKRSSDEKIGFGTASRTKSLSPLKIGALASVVLIVVILFLPLLRKDNSQIQEPSTQASKGLTSTDPVPQSTQEGPLVLSADELYAQACPAVVTIKSENEEGKVVATGSGFFIDKELIRARMPQDDFKEIDDDPEGVDAKFFASTFGLDMLQTGYVITNCHVIEAAVDADLILKDGTSILVWDVLFSDEQTDLALLRVFGSVREPFPTLSLASRDPVVGDECFAIGSPTGLANSLSEGIVGGRPSLPNGSAWVQITAPISPGSSGCPVLSNTGAVIGVAVASRVGGQNLNFAIPAMAVRTSLAVRTQYEPRELSNGASIARQETHELVVVHGQLVDSKLLLADEPNWGTALMKARKAPYPEAIDLVSRHLDEIPDDFRPFANLILARAQYYVAIDETRSKVHDSEELGLCLRRDSRILTAERLLIETTRQRPSFAPAFQQLAYLYETTAQWGLLEKTASQLISILPRCSEAYRLRSESRDELGDFKGAMDDGKAAVRLDPACPLARYTLGVSYYSANEYLMAAEAYEIADSLGFENKSFIYYMTADAYHMAGRFLKAIEWYEQARTKGWMVELIDSQINNCRNRRPPS